MVGACLILTGLVGAPSDHIVLAFSLLAVGILGIFGFRVMFYMKMKTLGITPKRIFGFGANR